jgi:hypothetical protein
MSAVWLNDNLHISKFQLLKQAFPKYDYFTKIIFKESNEKNTA